MSLEIIIRPSEKLSESEIKFLESGEINNIVVDLNTGEQMCIKVNPTIEDVLKDRVFKIKRN